MTLSSALEIHGRPSALAAAGGSMVSPEPVPLESRAAGGFAVGDMVWGKVTSHPWWPGQVFNPAFATPSVLADRRDPRHSLVAFFGDGSYGWFDPGDLLPFAPHFHNKSRQTSARAFLGAVDEAADEAARRAALALACPCRSPATAFRPTAVPGYLAVDVPSYEPGGIYTISQIQKAREGFAPQDMLAFLRRLATAPDKRASKNIDRIVNVALLRAYRKAVFEEHDETYVEAFALGLDDELDGAAPQALPSIPPVVTRDSGDQETGTEPGRKEPSAASPPTACHQEQPPPQPHDHCHVAPPLASKSQASVTVPSPSAVEVGDFVLQEKERLASLEEVEAGEKVCSEPQKGSGSGLLKARASDDLDSPVAVVWAGNIFTQDEEPPTDANDGSAKNTHGAAAAAEPKKVLHRAPPAGLDVIPEKKSDENKEKLLKRPREGPVHVDTKSEEKKKRKEGTGIVPGRSSMNESRVSKDTREDRRKSAGRSIGIGSGSGSAVPPSRSDSALPNRGLPQLRSDLVSLAVDPCLGARRGARSSVRRALTKFRSLVCEKSLVLPPASEPDLAELGASKSSVASVRISTGKELKVEREPSYAKPHSKPDGSIERIGQKRCSSDRLGEMAVKRLKRLDKLRMMANEKKPGVGQKPLEEEVRGREQKSTATKLALAKPSMAGPLKKSSPTWLVMKFPPETTLPSVASLKAKFARFGPLDLSGIKVHWKYHSCKVLFKYKLDAEAANRHVEKNNIFGQIRVLCYLRESEKPPAQELVVEDGKNPGQAIPTDAPQANSGNGGNSMGRPRPSSELQGQQPVQLKSCLKRPGDHEVSPPGGTALKESFRVKFSLGDGGAKMNPRLVPGSENNGGGSAIMKSPSVAPLGAASGYPRSLNSLLPPPPPQPPLLSPPHRAQFHPVAPRFADANHQGLTTLPPLLLTNPPSNIYNVPATSMRQPMISCTPAQVGQAQHSPLGHSDLGTGAGNAVDVSHQMLSLMVRCSDIVSSIKSSLGYVPYFAL